jgi:ketosteroid isomerase-like protein
MADEITISAWRVVLCQRFPLGDTGCSMSRENVELVRRLQPSGGIDLVEVFSEGFDAEATLDPDSELVHKDVEVQFIARGEALEGTVYRGLAGFVQGWREWIEAWTSYRIEVEEFVDAGDKVVVLVRVAARTVRDDVLMHHTPGAVWTIRDGKVASIHFYLDRSEALEAAGRPVHDAQINT